MFHHGATETPKSAPIGRSYESTGPTRSSNAHLPFAFRAPVAGSKFSRQVERLTKLLQSADSTGPDDVSTRITEAHRMNRTRRPAPEGAGGGRRLDRGRATATDRLERDTQRGTLTTDGRISPAPRPARSNDSNRTDRSLRRELRLLHKEKWRSAAKDKCINAVCRHSRTVCRHSNRKSLRTLAASMQSRLGSLNEVSVSVKNQRDRKNEMPYDRRRQLNMRTGEL